MGIVAVADHLLEEEACIEDIDPHADQGAIWLAGNGFGILGLLGEAGDAPVLAHADDAEIAGLLARHLDAGHGQVGLFGDVEGQQAAIVHLVDMVAGEDEDIFGVIAAQHVEVLEHGIGGALVPVLAHLLLGRQQVDELVEPSVEEAPASLQVMDQALRFVLRGDADAADTGVHAVRQREIDDAKFSGEGNGRLRAPVGELFEPAAAPARQDQRE